MSRQTWGMIDGSMELKSRPLASFSTARQYSSHMQPVVRLWIHTSVAIAMFSLSANASPVPRTVGPSEIPDQVSMADYKRLLLSGQYAQLDTLLSAIQSAYESRAIGDERLRAQFRVFYDPDPALSGSYEAWVSRSPKSYIAHLARGVYYVYVANASRGVQAANDTPRSEMLATETALNVAAQELQKSESLTRRPIFTYARELDISRLHGDPVASRRILDRALAIDPRSYVVRASYMAAIETRWGGSQAQMRAFLAECRKANLSAENLRLLQSVISEDEGWVHQFVDGDYAAAEAAYRRSAAMGGDQSLANLVVVLYKQGKNRELIDPLTEELAQKPNDIGLLENRAEAYMKSGQAKNSLADWRTSANLGSANAQNHLGVYYMTGIAGVLSPDPKVGVELFRKAASQGSPEGKHNLEQALKFNPTLR